MKFKTIYVDILSKEELHPKTTTFDGAFFMSLEDVNSVFSELRLVTDHISFSLFYDVNDHPQLKDVLQLAFDHELRYSIMLLSSKFLDHIDLYLDNHSLSEILICVDRLESSSSLDSKESIDQLVNGINQLRDNHHKIIIDLPTKNKAHYQANTLAFMNALGFDLEQENWVNGMRLHLDDYTTIQCCDRLKEPVNEVLPKKILGRCHGAVTMLGLMSDGTLIPCNHSRGQRIKLGNLLETPIVDILSKEPFISISEGFYKNQLVHPVCQYCPYPRKIF